MKMFIGRIRSGRIALFLVVLMGSGTAFAQTLYFYGRYVGVLTIEEPTEYFLTELGQNSYDNYDPNYGDPRQWDDCAPEGIPALLLTPGVATVDLLEVDDGNIEMRYERDDAIRTVHMNTARSAEGQSDSVLGYSHGYWADNVLTIETTNLTGGVVIAQTSYPLSADAHVTERYWREPGENDLKMEVVVDDPLNYSEPVRIGRTWVWSPDAPLLPWACVGLGQRYNDELDISELRRLLEEQ
jgi:hypothetical protein